MNWTFFTISDEMNENFHGEKKHLVSTVECGYDFLHIETLEHIEKSRRMLDNLNGRTGMKHAQ